MKIRTSKIIVYLLVLIVSLPVGLAGNSSKGAKAESSEEWNYTLLEDGTVSITGYLGSETKQLTIPEVIDGKMVTEIGSGAFVGCIALNSITIPDSVTSIGSGAFGCCIDLTSITIPDNVTSIGDGAFYFCCELTSITIPNNVTSIGDEAFADCERLKKITIKSPVLKSVGKNAIRGVKKNAVIKVPKGKAKEYKKLFTKKTGYKKTMKIK